MKKRSITLMMSALTISAALLATSPVLAETDAKDAAETTEESTDAKDTADDKDAEKAENTDAENTDDKKDASSAENTLEDGVYTAEFDTDSGMFHVNEANDGKGTLTVKDGKMTIHVSLASQKRSLIFLREQQKMRRKTEQNFSSRLQIQLHTAME